MLSEFATVFERKSDAYKVAHLHNAARALLSRSRCLRQQILTKISFVIFNIVVKSNPMWFSLVCILIDDDTDHHSSHNLL